MKKTMSTPHQQSQFDQTFPAEAGREKKTFSPETAQWWKVLNASHIGFDKILEEFLDNAISARAKTIRITLRQVKKNRFVLTVEDDGDGIAETALPQAFGVGHVAEVGNRGVYNKFGIGMKSGFASCDPENQTWQLCSRTEGMNTFLRMEAPYSQEEMSYEVCPEEQWPGELQKGKGTWLSVPVSRTLFNSVAPACKNNRERMAWLKEELAVTYTPLLEKVEIHFCWALLDGSHEASDLKPIPPRWVEPYVHGTELIPVLDEEDDAAEQEAEPGKMEKAPKMEVQFAFGRIERNPDTKKYFGCNIASSGLMVYLNGRLIQFNMFDEIWHQKHPSYNPFLFTVDIRKGEGNEQVLPMPTPDKDSMVMSDPNFAALLTWIHKVCPDPKLYLKKKKLCLEREMCLRLRQKLLESGAVTCEHLEMELLAETRAVRTDLYTCLKGGRSVLYEAKLNRSKLLDLAQLAIYALLAEEQNLQMDELVLVAHSHSGNVRKACEILRRRWFRDLHLPSIRLLTWEEVENGKF